MSHFKVFALASCVGLASRRFPESEPRFSRRLQPVIRDRQYGRDQMLSVLIEDLHDVAIRGRIQQLHHVLARLQDLVRNLDRLVNGENGTLVPLIRLENWRERGAEQPNAGRKSKHLEMAHIFFPPSEL